MRCYLLAFDLDPAGKDYAQVSAAIGKFPVSWRYFDCVWIVKTDWPVKQVRDHFKGHISGGAKLIVLELSGEGAWAGLSDEAVAWLIENL